MSTFYRTLPLLLLSTLLGLYNVHATCGTMELGWGTQADTDDNSGNPRTVLGFGSKGPFDAAGKPILSVIATNAGFDESFYAFTAFLCGQANPDSYPQTTFGPVISSSSDQCLTISELGVANATVSLAPCVNPVTEIPDATQTFEWIGTDYITYGFVFLGNLTGTPLPPSARTDYTPSIVATDSGSYLRLDYTPDQLPPSTGLETGMVLALSDD
ncbi:hypothetical protein B0H10DRAFT_2067064 [Mycena sp. CBHHK59/15]|nr:hypothetical protein B0H10DRAFT_2067064 [Mycena sp. CBHHK59/15]